MYYETKLFSFAIVWWALWNQRNKIRIELKFPKSPSDILYTVSSLFPRWKILLCDPEKNNLNDLHEQVSSRMRTYLARRRQEPAAEDFIQPFLFSAVHLLVKTLSVQDVCPVLVMANSVWLGGGGVDLSGFFCCLGLIKPTGIPSSLCIPKIIMADEFSLIQQIKEKQSKPHFF
jgi:hypothetical protein